MDWPDEPASEQQVMRLRNLGYVPTAHLTMTEAAKLIRQYQKGYTPGHQFLPAAPRCFPDPAPVNIDSVSESAKNLAHRLHETADKAKHAIALSPQASNVRADLVVAQAARLEFWLDTCRGINQMQVASVQVYELHHDYGHRLFAPMREQVQEILDALDAAMPAWEKEHPELFYQTLELNFPALVRKPRAEPLVSTLASERGLSASQRLGKSGR